MMIVRAFSRMACNRRIQGLSGEGGVGVKDWNISLPNDHAGRTHSRTPPSHRIDTAPRPVNWGECVSSRKRVRMLFAAELLHRARPQKKTITPKQGFPTSRAPSNHTLRKSGERTAAYRRDMRLQVTDAATVAVGVRVSVRVSEGR